MKRDENTLDLFADESVDDRRPPTVSLPVLVTDEGNPRLDRILAAARAAQLARDDPDYDTPDFDDWQALGPLVSLTGKDHRGCELFRSGPLVWQAAILNRFIVGPVIASDGGCQVAMLKDIVEWLVDQGHLDDALVDIHPEELADIQVEMARFRRPQETLAEWFEALLVGRLVCFRFDEFEAEAYVFSNGASVARARGDDYTPYLHIKPEPLAEDEFTMAPGALSP